MQSVFHTSRRQFMGEAAAVTLLGALRRRADAADAPAAEIKRRIRTGFVGGGGRGSWIAKLFQQHGGFEAVAVADYFQPVADNLGKALGVDPARRFSGLSGYKRVIESGAEAVILEVPPFFFPEHAGAAVQAGLHVYMAKPVAVDVPGSLAIEAAGKRSTNEKRVFLVDYQMPTDALNIEVAQRVRDGGLGKLAQVQTFGVSGGFGDPPRTGTLESRLRHLVWVNDVELGCDHIGNFDIHSVDAALWVIGARPAAAMGASRVCRPNPNGNARDVCSVVYEYADGLVHNHFGQGLRNNTDQALLAVFNGQTASAQINYWGKAFVRGGPKHFAGGEVDNLYQAGAVRNIAAFHRNITEGRHANETVPRAVDGCLACILGREAAARRGRLTMETLLKENTKLDVDLKGLKA